MTFAPGFNTARDVYDKLRRDADRLEAHVSPDEFFNFAVTGWALCEWAKQDPALTASHHGRAEVVQASQWLQLCRDVANGAKHFRITRYEPKVTATRARSGYGEGRFGKGAYGTGEHSLTIAVGETSYNALEIVEGVVREWRQFFEPDVSTGGGS